MEWKLAKDGSSLEYRDGDTVVDTLGWNSAAGCYVNRAGERMGREFNDARRAVESGVKPEERAQKMLFGAPLAAKGRT